VSVVTEVFDKELVMGSQSKSNLAWYRANRIVISRRVLTAILLVVLFFMGASTVSHAQEDIPTVPDTSKIKPGSIDDVNAIGTRNIGGRGFGNWYSQESEVNMGRQYAAQLDRSTKFISDPVVTENVNRIAKTWYGTLTRKSLHPQSD
jgi:predicted Zn-dependent protease